MTLLSDKPKGTVLRNLDLSDERVVLPSEERVSRFEGGKQIDPYLVAAMKMQELQKRIESLLVREDSMKLEIADLEDQLEKEKGRFAEREKSLRDSLAAENLELRREECDRGFKEGYDKGTAAAWKDIELKLKQQYSERFSDLEALILKVLEGLEEAVDRDIRESGPAMVKLWQMMLERLLRAKVDLDGEVALRVFRELMTKVSDRRRIKLFVNPSDMELFLSRSEEMAEIKRVAEIFDIVGDENIEKGSCVLETNMGIHDARWSSQLELIKARMDKFAEEIWSDGKKQAEIGI